MRPGSRPYAPGSRSCRRSAPGLSTRMSSASCGLETTPCGLRAAATPSISATWHACQWGKLPCLIEAWQKSPRMEEANVAKREASGAGRAWHQS